MGNRITKSEAHTHTHTPQIHTQWCLLMSPTTKNKRDETDSISELSPDFTDLSVSAQLSNNDYQMQYISHTLFTKSISIVSCIYNNMIINMLGINHYN